MSTSMRLRGASLDVRRRDRDPECSIRIAVNISGRHLIDDNLLLDIDHALESTGAAPALLELELAETQLLEDVERATPILDQVRSRGITIVRCPWTRPR